MTGKSGKHWQRLMRLVNAKASEYNRLVADNADLKAEALAFRIARGIRFCSPGLEYVEWLDREMSLLRERIRRENLHGTFRIPLLEEIDAEVDRLAKKYGAENWKDPIRQMILFGRPWTVFFGMGFPGENRERSEDGTWRTTIHIPSDFDPTNKFHQERLEEMRVRDEDPIPQPQPMKNNRRKLDWRPVWEWEARHPSITRAKIAKILRRNPVTVRRKLAELDGELGSPK